jgi:hypothetical protein
MSRMKQLVAREMLGRRISRHTGLFRVNSACSALALGAVLAGAATVTPTNITTSLCFGGNQTNTVRICLPQGTNAPVNITLTATPSLPAGLCGSFSPPIVTNVAPGGCASFLVFFNGCGPSTNASFNLNFVTPSSNSVVLGSIPVTVVPPLPVIHCSPNIVVTNGPTQCSKVVNYVVTASDPCAGSAVNVSIYSTHSHAGGGAPYAGFVGSFASAGVTFATDTGYNWHPFGATSFGADITGCLNVDADGIYNFALNSDDGSLLFIDGNLVVDNGGAHSPAVVSGSAVLTTGQHTFEVQFFEDSPSPSGVDLGLPPGVSYGSCGLVVTCEPPSGSVFPAGTTTVHCRAVDASGNTNTCSFTVTVEDKEAPVAACRPAANPSGKNIPPSGNNGQNPDGYFELLGRDNCDPNPLLFVLDTGSSFVAGPFHSGDVVKIRQNPGGKPSSTPGHGLIVAEIHLRGDGLVHAVDASGNVGTGALCLVPPSAARAIASPIAPEGARKDY